MLRNLMMLACVAGLVVVASPALAGDCAGCTKVSDSGDGFCCGKGLAFGVNLTSQNLYKALVGEKVDAAKIECKGCKKAAGEGGSCCGKSFAHGNAYKSPVAFKLAKGEAYTAKKAEHCSNCKKAFGDDGFCSGCNAGFVAGRIFKDKESYDAALGAHKVLAKAAASKCEACAVAMVTDGTCDHCKVSFKDGKKIKS